MKHQKIFKILTLILIMQWAFIKLISQFPTIIENYYSNGIYPIIAFLFRFLFGWIPFSIGDLFYVGMVIVLGYWLFQYVKQEGVTLKNTLYKFGAFASVLFFLFHLNWGLNYQRLRLFDTLQLENNTYTQDDLLLFTNELIVKTNELHLKITKADDVVENQLSKQQIREKAQNSYISLAQKFPQFTFKTASVKNSIFSLPLTYMGFAGYLNPFTNEAQVNGLIPKNNYPATLCHELAHQAGIASESEASFVGYLAATNYNDLYYNYSGYIMALNYCLSEIFKNDEEIFKHTITKLNSGILKDMQNSSDFWQSYQNWSEKYFKTFYDYFLKFNKQKDGMKEYNKVVALLINYHKKEKLN
ncbi:DUF3810 domain-containing protein [Lutibacter sp.]|uniref:DUF3810 domain-containing protein n=1 Tax=Lutibacter sp. TaxID=1925666 RepID=UPI0027351F29|nr:DUF3810 domain-containing protein [Lutibacter sp.]MDP3312659.1 DUF3810 domain-containing protein [Lutibacter sp.]